MRSPTQGSRDPEAIVRAEIVNSCLQLQAYYNLDTFTSAIWICLPKGVGNSFSTLLLLYQLMFMLDEVLKRYCFP